MSPYREIKTSLVVGPHEAINIPIGVVSDPAGVNVQLEAACPCGLALLKVAPAEWKCPRLKWWRFWDRRHARLTAVLVKEGGA